MFGRTRGQSVLSSEFYELKQRHEALEKNFALLYQYIQDTNEELAQLREFVEIATRPPESETRAPEPQKRGPRGGDFDHPFFD